MKSMVTFLQNSIDNPGSIPSCIPCQEHVENLCTLSLLLLLPKSTTV